MKQHYFIRNTRVNVEQVDDLIAVKPDDTGSSGAYINRIFGPQIAEPRHGANEDDWRAMEQAGWVFVAAREGLMRHIAESRQVPGAKRVQRMFIHDDGRIALGLDRMCIRFADEGQKKSNIQAWLRARGLVSVGSPNMEHMNLLVRVLPGAGAFLEMAKRLSEDKSLVYAEPEFIEHIPGRMSANAWPQAIDSLWHWKKIEASAAWGLTKGNGVRVAVIDNGFQFDHPNIKDALEPSCGYFEENGQDGATFTRDMSNSADGSHGTPCAGLAVARGVTESAVCGIAKEAKLIAVACLLDQTGGQETLARAIEYAVAPKDGNLQHPGADIISCSLGPSGVGWPMHSRLKDAIDLAVTTGRNGRGVPLFWAVSNRDEPIENDQVCAYERTIAISSSTRSDFVESQRGHGKELDMIAPGRDVWSTKPISEYREYFGTSIAAPIAAGVGALMLSVNSLLSWTDVRQILRETCDKNAQVTFVNNRNDHYGWGRVNAFKAVKAAQAARPPQ